MSDDRKTTPENMPTDDDADKTSEVLRLGAHGDDVLKLQQRLNQLGYHLDEDGAYGPRTATAVAHLQARSGLPVDGLAGPLTQSALTEHRAGNHAHLGDHWERESQVAGIKIGARHRHDDPQAQSLSEPGAHEPKSSEPNAPHHVDPTGSGTEPGGGHLSAGVALDPPTPGYEPPTPGYEPGEPPPPTPQTLALPHDLPAHPLDPSILQAQPSTVADAPGEPVDPPEPAPTSDPEHSPSATASGDTRLDHEDTSHEDTSHEDTSHEDTSHEDTSHEDTSHEDTSHEETHASNEETTSNNEWSDDNAEWS